jgi:hypothetical protein
MRGRVDYRKIWVEAYGEIPLDENGQSYEIHHIDGNRKNNSINNLMCVSLQEHFDIHYKQGDFGAASLIADRMGKVAPSGWTRSTESVQRGLDTKKRNGTDKQSKEHIRRRVEARKRNGNHKHSEETKQKIRKSLQGRPKSEETVQKLKDFYQDRPGTMTGRKHTQEAKDKVVKALTGRKLSQETIEKRTATSRKNGSYEKRTETRRKRKRNKSIHL